MKKVTLSANVTDIILTDEAVLTYGGFDVVPSGYDLVQFIDQKLINSKCFLDVGANVGSFTLLAKGYSNTQFISFEPVKKTFNILKENIELNNISNVILINKGLSNDKEDKIIYIPGEDNLGGSSVISSSQKIQYEELCSFDILDNYIDYEPDLIKIDVEGHEYSVLEGGLNLLKKYHPMLLIEDNPPSTEEEKNNQMRIHQLLNSLNYTIYQFNSYNILAVYES
jgi:FkbM family methyltransferase